MENKYDAIFSYRPQVDSCEYYTAIKRDISSFLKENVLHLSQA